MPTYYSCANCGQDISIWVAKAGADCRCPYCGIYFDVLQIHAARNKERIKGAFAFFLLFSFLATLIACFFVRDVIVFIIGPAVGALATVVLCVVMLRRDPSQGSVKTGESDQDWIDERMD